MRVGGQIERNVVGRKWKNNNDLSAGFSFFLDVEALRNQTKVLSPTHPHPVQKQK